MYIARAKVFNDLYDENPPEIYWTTVDPNINFADSDLEELPSGSIVIQVDGTGGRDDSGTNLVQIYKKKFPTPTTVGYNGDGSYVTLAPSVLVSAIDPISVPATPLFTRQCVGSIVFLEDPEEIRNDARIKISELGYPVGPSDWRKIAIAGKNHSAKLGGTLTLIDTAATNAATVGGNGNLVEGNNGVAVGGEQNTVSGVGAIVAGGRYNTASGQDSATLGGSRNLAVGARAVAIGTKARPTHQGAVLISTLANGAPTMATDTFASAATEEFAVRSAGVRILTNLAESAGVTMAAGGSSWVTVSDANAKDRITEIVGDIADFYDELKIVSYVMGEEQIGVGITAQNYYATFPFLQPKRVGAMFAINQAERDGIQDKAIQELVRRVQLLEQENVMLRARLDSMELRITRLEG